MHRKNKWRTELKQTHLGQVCDSPEQLQEKTVHRKSTLKALLKGGGVVFMGRLISCSVRIEAVEDA